MINLEVPKKLRGLTRMVHDVARGMFRPISRKYDRAEHTYPVELDALKALISGMDDAGAGLGAGNIQREAKGKRSRGAGRSEVRNGSNMRAILNVIELAWGDLGLMLTIPGQGLGNAAIAAVATPEQKERFQGRWAAMAITEPDAGSDSAAIRTTARLDGDHWVLDGEKIFVTCGDRADLIVVWATLDRAVGRSAIKSFVVERGAPGCEVTRVEDKLGIRASDTATIAFTGCRIPRANLLGSEEIEGERAGFAGVMQTFDNTRPMVAAMGIGIARAALETTRELVAREGVAADYSAPAFQSDATEAEIYRMEADLEAARLLALKAAWMADNGTPNSMHASMSKAKAGRVASAVTLKCVELCGAIGYGEAELLEKWARDAKIVDIFEGTQQIQQLIIARRLLGKSSSELK